MRGIYFGALPFVTFALQAQILVDDCLEGDYLLSATSLSVSTEVSIPAGHSLTGQRSVSLSNITLGGVFSSHATGSSFLRFEAPNTNQQFVYRLGYGVDENWVSKGMHLDLSSQKAFVIQMSTSGGPGPDPIFPLKLVVTDNGNSQNPTPQSAEANVLYYRGLDTVEIYFAWLPGINWEDINNFYFEFGNPAQGVFQVGLTPVPEPKESVIIVGAGLVLCAGYRTIRLKVRQRSGVSP